MADLSAAIRRHLNRADDLSNPSHVRGRACEDAVEQIFRSVPGCKTKRNALDYYHSSEIDLIVSNERRQDGLRLLPKYFLVECKHYTEPISSMIVRDFRAKIQDRNCKLGVLVAANGVSGGKSSERRSAYHAATCALNQKIEILLLTRDDLTELRSSADVVNLLHDRRMELKSTTTFPYPRRPPRNRR
ncbi:restriction endonuclease [Nocardia sp. CA-135398]|uniref:restriction endonuclease n=1 Tax=Nocardia sp. CA-135398 TaxID=3239977 RepID=UPI003D9792FF